MTEVAERVVIALDLFPSNATVQSTTYRTVRTVIADGQLQIWTFTAAGPQVIYQGTVTGPIDGSIPAGINAPTTDGNIWVEQAGGCGCGNALRLADLFPGRQKVFTGLR